VSLCTQLGSVQHGKRLRVVPDFWHAHAASVSCQVLHMVLSVGRQLVSVWRD
jgi:hypothetical protein